VDYPDIPADRVNDDRISRNDDHRVGDPRRLDLSTKVRLLEEHPMRTSPHFLKVFALLLCFGMCCLAVAPLTLTSRAKSSGTQRTATTSEISITAPGKLVTADFNGDTYPDLVVNQYDSTNRYISVVLSDGTGGYLTPTQFTVGPIINGTVGADFTTFARDFNNDGKSDIAVLVLGGVIFLNPFPASIKYYPGLGNGTFDAPITTNPIGGDQTAFIKAGMVGDVNNDSKLDFIFITRLPGPNQHGSSVLWAYGNGAGGFVDSGSMQVNNNADGLAAADFTGDGKLDVVVQSSGDNCPQGGICMNAFQSLIGDGAGNFVRNVMASMGGTYMQAGDFNNDGKLDVFSRSGIILGDGAGGFTLSTPLPANNFTAATNGTDTAVSDINQDGKLDGVMLKGSRIALYFGNGAGGISTAHYFMSGLDLKGIAVADFNHNGKPDLAVAVMGENKIRIYHDDVLPDLQSRPVYDIDGDGRTDIAVYRPGAPGAWYFIQSSNNTFQGVPFGTTGDIPVPAGYGSGPMKLTVFRPSNGTWYTSNYPSTGFSTTPWGLGTDTPVPGGDYDGDGTMDLAVYRVTGGTGTFYLKYGLSGNTIQFGNAGDKPVVGDFDGDGKTDIAVYRPGATATDESFWRILRSSDQVLQVIQFGIGEDKPVAGDFDGDQITNIAVFRPSIGYWFTSLDPATNYGARQWGQSGDVPMTGDFDGDGKIDLSVYRGGNWYLLTSSNTTFLSYGFGLAADKPIPATGLPQ
jgi:hypothetical protein